MDRRSALVAVLVVAGPLLVASTCGLESGAPECGHTAVNWQLSRLGPDGLPQGPVTAGDLMRHPEASLVPPGVLKVHRFSMEECNTTFGSPSGVHSAYAGANFEALTGSTAPADFYAKWLAQHGWRTGPGQSPLGDKVAMYWTRESRESFSFASDNSNAYGPADPRYANYYYDYSIEPHCMQVSGDQSCAR